MSSSSSGEQLYGVWAETPGVVRPKPWADLPQYHRERWDYLGTIIEEAFTFARIIYPMMVRDAGERVASVIRRATTSDTRETRAKVWVSGAKLSMIQQYPDDERLYLSLRTNVGEAWGPPMPLTRQP